MDSLIEYKIDKDFDKNEYYYFFTLLNNRFEIINDYLAKNLERRFNKKFKPIYILQAKRNSFFKQDNYIILNHNLKKIQKQMKIKRLIYLQDLEDLNLEFANSSLIKKITKKLVRKQNIIFMISFTSFGLDKIHPKIINIGPDASVVNKYENKIEQIKLFKRLNLPLNETKIYKNVYLLLKDKKVNYPIYISPSYTSGGHESKIAFCRDDIIKFKNQLRPCNKKEKIFVSKFIKNIKLSPNGTAIVIGKNKTVPMLISDQILRNNIHLGNLYPSKTSKKNQKQIINTLIKIGNFLSLRGFKGLFGCDFIIDDKDNCFVIDLNPRRQSGYLPLLLMSKKIDILNLEVNLALNQKIPKISYSDFQCNFSWGHSKIKPYSEYSKLKKEIKINSVETPFLNIGKRFICSYFPKGYILNGGYCGYYIITHQNSNKIISKIKIEVNKLINQICESV